MKETFYFLLTYKKEILTFRDGNNDYEPSGYQKTQTIMDWIKITLKEYDALP